MYTAQEHRVPDEALGADIVILLDSRMRSRKPMDAEIIAVRDGFKQAPPKVREDYAYQSLRKVDFDATEIIKAAADAHVHRIYGKAE